jgi:hypothetical protein
LDIFLTFLNRSRRKSPKLKKASLVSIWTSEIFFSQDFGSCDFGKVLAFFFVENGYRRGRRGVEGQEEGQVRVGETGGGAGKGGGDGRRGR